MDNPKLLYKLGAKSFNLLSNQSKFSENKVELPTTQAISSDMFEDIIKRTGFRELLETEFQKLDPANKESRMEFTNKLFNSFPTVEDLKQKCPDIHKELVDF